jgi:hypothetical protein
MKLAVLGTRGALHNIEGVNNIDAMRLCGNNTGNLLFEYVISELLSPFNDLVYLDDLQDDLSIDELARSDFLIIPAADFLTFEYDLPELWNRIKWSNIPIIIIGIGISASFDFAERERLGDSFKNILNHFKKYATLICCRGPSTCRVLMDMGFDNNKLVVTGCPSNFCTSNDFLNESFSARLRNPCKDFEKFKPLIYGDRYWDLAKVDVEMLLYKIFRKTNGAWVAQSHIPIIDMIRPNLSSEDFYSIAKNIAFLHHSLNPLGDISNTFDDIKNRYKLFFNVSDWLSFSADYDFSLGLRLHGNMVSLQAGVPTLWYAHDNRTNELSDIMALPTINKDQLYQLSNNLDLDLIYGLFASALPNYYERRAVLFDVFESAFNSVGIKIRKISM